MQREMTIEVRGLKIYSHHGCYEEERRVGTNFTIDADLVIDGSRPAETDNVADALNYVEVCETMAEIMKTPHHLLESLADEMAREIKGKFASRGLKGGWLRIAKMAPPIGLQLESVAVKVKL